MANWIHDLASFIYALVAHWQAYVTGGIVTALICVIERKLKRNISWRRYAIYMTISLFYAAFQAWQDEHRNMQTVIAEKAIQVGNVSSCQAELKTAKASLDGEKSLVDTFQKTLIAFQAPLVQEQSNIATCINTLARMNPKIAEEVEVAVIPIAHVDKNDKLVSPVQLSAKQVSLFLVATNLVHDRFRGRIHCDDPFVPDAPFLLAVPGGSAVVRSLPYRINDREYELNFTVLNVQWGPLHPAYFFADSDNQITGKCLFSSGE